MYCAKCKCDESKVIDSRLVEEGNSIRRRRECLKCKFRFTTYEKIEYTPIVIIKKNGSRQFFDREKILKGLIKACEKRPISMETIEKIVNDIELELNNSLDKEIPSAQIGELIIKYLRDVDDIAYVRFASVYRQFKDINEFNSELNKLLTKLNG